MDFHIAMISQHKAVVFISGKHLAGIINQLSFLKISLAIGILHGIHASLISRYLVGMPFQTFRTIHKEVKGSVKFRKIQLLIVRQRLGAVAHTFAIFLITVIRSKLCPVMIRSEIDVFLFMCGKSIKNIYRIDSFIHQAVAIGNGLIHPGGSQLFLHLRIQDHAKGIGHNHGAKLHLGKHGLHRV